LIDSEPFALAEALNQAEPELRGFAYEGAAMALFLLDRLTPWRRNRFETLLAGEGQSHVYMMYVGAGWAIAKLHRRPGPLMANMDPLLRWLVLDGLGFCETYFHPRRTLVEQNIPRSLRGYESRAFDQGVGRGMWFALGANAQRISPGIAAFADSRQSDLWSGVGLASAYAGGVDDVDLEFLRRSAGRHAAALAQGAAFAAKARQRAGNPAPHTESACHILCGMTADCAAAVTDEVLAGLTPADIQPSYEVWRQRIQLKLGG
jgi:hypothetical protein